MRHGVVYRAIKSVGFIRHENPPIFAGIPVWEFKNLGPEFKKVVSACSLKHRASADVPVSKFVPVFMPDISLPVVHYALMFLVSWSYSCKDVQPAMCSGGKFGQWLKRLTLDAPEVSGRQFKRDFSRPKNYGRFNTVVLITTTCREMEVISSLLCSEGVCGQWKLEEHLDRRWNTPLNNSNLV